jgi:YD repeat-containing protein
MTETTALKPDIDWGPNADGWQLIIENRTKYELQVDYSPSSNVRWADPKIIPAGQSGRVKGFKGVVDPADIVCSYSRTSGLGWSIVGIRSTFGAVTRMVRNGADRVIEANFPDQPRNEAQRVILQSRPATFVHK